MWHICLPAYCSTCSFISIFQAISVILSWKIINAERVFGLFDYGKDSKEVSHHNLPNTGYPNLHIGLKASEC